MFVRASAQASLEQGSLYFLLFKHHHDPSIGENDPSGIKDLFLSGLKKKEKWNDDKNPLWFPLRPPHYEH